MLLYVMRIMNRCIVDLTSIKYYVMLIIGLILLLMIEYGLILLFMIEYVLCYLYELYFDIKKLII